MQKYREREKELGRNNNNKWTTRRWIIIVLQKHQKNIEKMELFDFNDLKYNKIRLIKTTITLTFWLI